MLKQINKDIEKVEEGLSMIDAIIDSEIHNGWPTDGSMSIQLGLKIGLEALYLKKDIVRLMHSTKKHSEMNYSIYESDKDPFRLGLTTAFERSYEEIEKIIKGERK